MTTISAGDMRNSHARRRFITDALKSVTDICEMEQIHGSVIIVNPSCKDVAHKADGIISTGKKTALAVRVADCIPVIIWNAKTRCIGAFHAGWRGLKQEILTHGLLKQFELTRYDRENYRAWIGPHICGSCYRVSMEFIKENFPAYGSALVRNSDKSYGLDLKSIACLQLIRAGLLSGHIFCSAECTCEDFRFPSYRRDGENAKRALAFAAYRGT